MPHKLEERIHGMLDIMLEDYGRGRTIDASVTFDHPSKDTVIEILMKLRSVIFPGYFRNETYRVYTMRNQISMLLEDVIYNLIRQISICLVYSPDYEDASPEIISARAEEITFAFIARIPEIRAYVEMDVQAAFDGDPAAYSKDEIIYSYPGQFAILVSRIAHQLYLLGVPLIPRIMTEYAHSQTGIDIHPGATLGRYFFIDHGTGIVIGETTEIGDNVKVYQGVTLGALSTRGGQLLKSKKRHPTICDNVTIYSGASILGGETVIGQGAVIGANAFITSSIPEGARVSIKNQELHYKYPSQHKAETTELKNDNSWFYVI
ncbi:MAG: serine acetyltransferase [Oscillospiraceae bacterium]|nr:serine acetyltransferase [Oscillospiraceae bacterium]